nr:hypothetical protein [Tanacetum cinerariifolium]
STNRIEEICQVGFRAGAHGMLGRRCRKDLVHVGCTGIPWGRNGNSTHFGGKSGYRLLGQGMGLGK